MKILQVYPYFYPAWGYGGVTRSTYEISKRLADRGHIVTVYTTDALDNKSRIPINSNPTYIDGVKTYYFRNLSNYLTYKHHIPLPLEMPFRIKEEIKKFDIIHLQGYRHSLNIIAHHYAKKYDIPYVLQPRGGILIMNKSKQKKFFDMFFGHSIVEDARKIIASSKKESNQYRDIFSELKDEKIIHIPNGINLETYQNLPQKGEFKKKHLVKIDEKIILFLSRIHERKGADILIEAFSKLKKELGEVKLVIAGPDDGYLDKLRLTVSNLNIDSDVIFPGPLYERDKLEGYVDADVFVLPSKDEQESFGNVVLEASAYGTPSVVTNVCGVTEWMDNIIPVNPSVKSIEEGIKEGLKHRELGEKAKNEVIEKFSWGKIVGTTEGVYEEVASCFT